jgi:hypothetical protein
MRLLLSGRFACLWLSAALVTVPFCALANELDAGPLDRPLPVTEGEKPGVVSGQASSLSGSPAQTQAQLRAEVAQEQEELEKLTRDQLEARAEQGERAAQVVLGADFAKEASLLAFAPAAANDALSDAARWYSLAASRGFPGAPSLDQAGIRFYPIRIQREPKL